MKTEDMGGRQEAAGRGTAHGSDSLAQGGWPGQDPALWAGSARGHPVRRSWGPQAPARGQVGPGPPRGLVNSHREGDLEARRLGQSQRATVTAGATMSDQDAAAQGASPADPCPQPRPRVRKSALPTSGLPLTRRPRKLTSWVSAAGKQEQLRPERPFRRGTSRHGDCFCWKTRAKVKSHAAGDTRSG